MAKAFRMLRESLAGTEVTVGNGVIINQYPQK